MLEMASAEWNILYFPQGPLDKLIEEEQGRELEFAFELRVNEMREEGADDAQIAIELVRESCQSYSTHPFQNDDGSTTFKSEVDVHGKYLSSEYWSEKFTKSEYCEEFWHQKYHTKDLSRAIPEDRIDRMVLYFLRGFLRDLFYKYMLDEDICESERLAVLKKQLENFSFYSRRRPFGSIWTLKSEPNKLLQAALQSYRDSDRDSTDSNDPEKVASAPEEGNSDKFEESPSLRFISGGRISLTADKSIPRDAGDGPKLDSVDEFIFRGVQQYASTQLKPDTVHNSWTMVRGCFKDRTTDIRCYAFSGHAQSGKELHRMPGEWWAQCENRWAQCENRPESIEINVVNVDASQFGHNMVLALFTALKPAIKEDLSKLASHVVFGELKDAEQLIVASRQDIVVLHYGEFYDHVISLSNTCDEKIKKSINKGISKFDATAQKLVETKKIWHCVSVGSYNKQFRPDKEMLVELLSEQYNPKVAKEIGNIMARISQSILSKFEEEIKKLPALYLKDLLNKLQISRCAEDNAIGSVLRQLLLLNYRDAFLNTPVTFVAMDEDHKDGKPFCSVCAHKVRFYSVLPILLRAIGSTGEDFDKLAPLFATLREIHHHPNSA